MAENVPLINALFSVDLGPVQGVFMECSGIEDSFEVVTSRQVDSSGKTVYNRVPGVHKPAETITLKRGISFGDISCWTWYNKVRNGDWEGSIVTGSIKVHKYDGSEAGRWNLVDVWPVAVKGPTFKADANEPVVEELTITFNSFERVT